MLSGILKIHQSSSFNDVFIQYLLLSLTTANTQGSFFIKEAFRRKAEGEILYLYLSEHCYFSTYIYIYLYLLPHPALSWSCISAENLANPSLQDRATEWHYYLASPPGHPPTRYPRLKATTGQIFLKF